MDQFDFVIIGSGVAGEAAGHLARERGATVAVVERDLVGGSCAFFACMPSKTLLHAAGIHALGGDYSWARAVERRDWMINRLPDGRPGDAGHVRSLEQAGATVLRGDARLDGPGRVVVTGDEGRRTVGARTIVVAVGSNSTIPPIEGLDETAFWTNREATTTRELPRSLAILGGGPTGVELAQVFARYGVPTTVVHSRDRLVERDHPRNSDALAAALRAAGATLRLDVRASRIVAGGAGARHRIELSDGSHVEAHQVFVAVGRTSPVDGLGLDTVGATLRDGRVVPDDSLRIAEGVFVAGDPAGPEMHTHLAHYQGEMVVRIALGEDVRPDYRAIPRATYTDPETAGVGLRLDQALEQGIDAYEETEDLATTAKGYVAEAGGHVTLVVDRGSSTLAGAFIAGPGATEAIHEAVLAIRARVPLAMLAETIHAFPTTSRVMGLLFTKAARRTGR